MLWDELEKEEWVWDWVGCSGGEQVVESDVESVERELELAEEEEEEEGRQGWVASGCWLRSKDRP